MPELPSSFGKCRGGVTIGPVPAFEDHALSRLLFFLLLLLPGVASAQTALTVATADGPVAVKVYAAPGEAPRPAVLILHGLGGDNPLPGYVSLAEGLAASGIDAWLFSYYTPSDQAIMFGPNADAHHALYETRMPAWAKKVDEVAEFALTQKQSSGQFIEGDRATGTAVGVAVETAKADSTRKVARTWKP